MRLFHHSTQYTKFDSIKGKLKNYKKYLQGTKDADIVLKIQIQSFQNDFENMFFFSLFQMIIVNQNFILVCNYHLLPLFSSTSCCHHLSNPTF